MSRKPRVDCLCVTENRPEFMPWLLWSFERQTWPNKTLTIVDSSEPELQMEPHSAVRVVRMPRGTRVAAKRNRALDEADGDYIAWFDDDDWQHPERLERLLKAADDAAVAIGVSQSWFLDLWGDRCATYRASSGIIFNGALFKTELARSLRFDESRTRAADTGWMLHMATRFPQGFRQVSGLIPFLWLSHSTNLSNPRARRSYDLALDELRRHIGASAWMDTDARLESLRASLGCPSAPLQRSVQVTGYRPRIVGSWNGGQRVAAASLAPMSSRDHTDPNPVRALAADPRVSADPARPPVAAMIKATVLDAPYLRTMVRHMLAQARAQFKERVVVVDRRPEFSGKYQSRPRGTRAELEAALAELIDEDVIDRVLDVPTDPEEVRSITVRYFGPDGERMPTHAVSGGPIFPTLFGLEAVDCDHVVAMDADMFFHAADVSWVSEGLRLFDDPTTWLVMTHAGPPDGPMGTQSSLGRNASRAKWDPIRRVFRFKTASTRYFLTDRRRLRGRLPILWKGEGVLPLEQCISAGLERAGAYRLCLAIEGSWDLHAHYHGDPFADWAPQIAELVKQGSVPRLQRGDYDLRLDKPLSRLRWDALIQKCQHTASTVSYPAVSTAKPTTAQRCADAQSALPISIVVAVRDRAGVRVNNMLASLAWQRPQLAAEVIVVSLGSQPDIDGELEQMCQRWGARFLQRGLPTDPWCKPLALNAGIRSTDVSSRYVMTIDADIILAPNFLRTLHSELTSNPKSLVLCRISDLARTTMLPDTPEVLLDSLTALHRQSRLRGTHGSGAIQAAAREFFFEIRGYDEDLRWWGAEDGDMLQRAERAGLALRWLEDRTFMLHQWHPKCHGVLSDGKLRREARIAWVENHRLVRERAEIVRNPSQWGGRE